MLYGTNEDYDDYCFKLRSEESARRLEAERLKKMKEKDQEIQRLKLRVNDLIAQINVLKNASRSTVAHSG